MLSEYLASHGFVVASARFGGTPLPLPWEMTALEDKVRVFDQHYADLRLALRSLKGESIVDGSSVGVLTWSYAAELAPRLQVDHDEIRIVIGLSSNPLAAVGTYRGAAAGASLVSAQLSATYVVMTERIGPNGQERVAPPIMARLPTESYFVTFPELAHGNFNAVEGMIPGVFGLTGVQPWSKAGAVAKLGYETIARYTLHFLDRRLNRGFPAERGLPGWEAELPEGFVATTRYGR